MIQSAWVYTAIGLLPPLLIALAAAASGSVAFRLVAIEFAASIGLALLIVFGFAFEQPSSTDLALAFALLALPGTLVFTLFEERWL